MRGQLWSREEWEKAKAMLAQGFLRETVAAEIGRTLAQLRQKIAWENMSPEVREMKRNRINNWRRAKAALKPAPVVRHRVPSPILEKAPPELFVERARRQMAQRDLTGEFFGDPPPGYSALDRREQRA